ncbi:DUF222 domain-containing protein [Blastococcus litoris]|uniref:DUF222 domain-containing protein n=1 Tax=Blastococcus litoris TaxID=2171622 RepID=UPI001F132659|nr:DUF222 domain-containing protein [Blastococcus litoris]
MEQEPPAGWATGPLRVVQEADREVARQTARRARAVVEFAAARPATADRAPGEPGSMSAARRAARAEVLSPVSEWAAPELSIALSITGQAAEALLERSLTLVHRLPRTLAALEAGLLHVGHLWPLLEKVAPVGDATVRARLEEDVLAWMAGRQVTTPAQLGAKIRRELLARDVRSAARELEAAIRRRGVHVRPDRVDGMAVLTALFTVPEAEAMLDALGQCADAVEDDPATGPPRTREQRMADCLLDLVLRPGETTLPVVQAQLTVVAGVATLAGGDEPGEIAGHPVPAEMVRALARALGLLPGEDEPGARDEDGSTVLAEAPEGTAARAAAEADDQWWAELEERALRGEWRGADEPPPEELQRWWAEEESWPSVAPWPDDGDPAPGASSPALGRPAPITALGTGPSWWAAADLALVEVGASQLQLYGALARARRAVEEAEIADLADREEWELSPAAAISSAPDALAALEHASAAQRTAVADLLRRTAGGGLTDRPRIAVTNALTGALVALTDARELRRAATAGDGLGPPPGSPTYRPGAALDRFARARDRRCRFPGCRRRVPRTGELDHHRPWPAGPTTAGNLTGFCTSHHRGKHQAPGWRFHLSSAGTLTVTTPSGVAARTAPPPF